MLSTVFGIAVAVIASVVVWFTVGAGVFQLVRDGVGRVRHRAGAHRPVAREGLSHRAA